MSRHVAPDGSNNWLRTLSPDIRARTCPDVTTLDCPDVNATTCPLVTTFDCPDVRATMIPDITWTWPERTLIPAPEFVTAILPLASMITGSVPD